MEATPSSIQTATKKETNTMKTENNASDDGGIQINKKKLVQHTKLKTNILAGHLKLIYTNFTICIHYTEQIDQCSPHPN